MNEKDIVKMHSKDGRIYFILREQKVDQKPRKAC